MGLCLRLLLQHKRVVLRELLILHLLLQAEMLHGREKSPLLAQMAERLRMLKAAAEVREERQDRRTREPIAKDVEVSETTHEDFAETERSWNGSLPNGLVPPERPA